MLTLNNEAGNAARAKILTFVKEYKLQYGGWTPSIRQICDACGIRYPSVVHTHLATLATLGEIEFIDTDSRHRHIRLPGEKYTLEP